RKNCEPASPSRRWRKNWATRTPPRCRVPSRPEPDCRGANGSSSLQFRRTSSMTLCTAQTLLTGRIKPYTRPGSFSAIHKLPRSGKLRVGPHGIDGDEHGDPKVHGGPDKAILHYAYDHYPYWLGVYDGHPLLAAPGAFGENISSIGVTEADVCLGDVISCGSTLLQVTQSRQPCWKMNDRL